MRVSFKNWKSNFATQSLQSKRKEDVEKEKLNTSTPLSCRATGTLTLHYLPNSKTLPTFLF